jgi:hypothetical protein
MAKTTRRAKSNRKSSSHKRSKKNQLRIEGLEKREMFAISSVSMLGSTLVVNSDDVATSAEVRQVGSDIRITDLGTGRSWTRSNVGSVEFRGGNGNDRFVNYVPNLPVRALGGAGHDYLEGYNGADTFFGGAGNDTLVGYGGIDHLWGGDGDDTLSGQGGNDHLYGGAGRDKLDGGPENDHLDGDADFVDYGVPAGEPGDDYLQGGLGTDDLFGGAGNDVLIAIDAAYTDYIDSGTGADVVWNDLNVFSRDNVVGATSSDMVQNVMFFANGADRTLDGDRIADPAAKGAQTYRSFADNPLFSSSGPRLSDVRQGQLDDAYALAGLGAIANDNPHALRQNVVDFNDGTFGVRLGSRYYRVDNDLPVNGPASTTPANAQLGAQNSMWVAIVEKAFAHYRTGANSYASIERGSPVEINRAFRSTSAGQRAGSSYANAAELANDLFTRWNTRQAGTIQFGGSTARGGAPLEMGHVYTVATVTRNASGTVTGITLRNPRGVDGGGNRDANPNDGLVNVTPAQIFAQDSFIVNWGRV